MTSERKIRANRENARASTGPKTMQGRARAAQNHFRHGLSIPVHSDPAWSEEVQALARAIAGRTPMTISRTSLAGSRKRTSICAAYARRAIDYWPTD